MTTALIPLTDVRAHRREIGDEIDAAIARVVDHGLWIMGPEIQELEEALAEWAGPGVSAISCANGTDALALTLRALGLEPGQGVVCPSFTFVATAEAVVLVGGVPIFADVGSDFNLDPGSVRIATAVARDHGIDVVGIIAVDLFGQPADYSALQTVADEFDVWLAADAAQSFGGSDHAGNVGSLAKITTTSFFPTKPLGCYGDGGAVFTLDSELAEHIRSLRLHGRGTGKHDNVRTGQNSRLDTLQAAILLPKLNMLDEELAARREVAATYEDLLDGLLGIGTPQLRPTVTSAWAQYTILAQQRDRLIDALDQAGIGTAVYYSKPLHEQPAYQRYQLTGVDLGCSSRLSAEVLSLPLHPYLETSEVETVCKLITEFASSD